MSESETGQATREHATAWNAREATWSMVIAGIDSDPKQADALKTWGREYWKAVQCSPGELALVFRQAPGEPLLQVPETQGVDLSFHQFAGKNTRPLGPRQYTGAHETLPVGQTRFGRPGSSLPSELRMTNSGSRCSWGFEPTKTQRMSFVNKSQEHFHQIPIKPQT